MSYSLALVLMLLLSFPLDFGKCTDIISSTRSINDLETIVSDGGTFKLGFFSPANSTNCYVGILYNIPILTPVRVANRDKPLNDSFGSVSITEDGNIVVLYGRKQIISSSNVSNSMPNSTAMIMDTGNLVLQAGNSSRTLWESFKHPSDSFLRSMWSALTTKQVKRIFLTSWRSPSDPSIGSFSFGIDPFNIPELFIWNGSKPHWRSGPWNGQVFIGVATMRSEYRRGSILQDDTEGRVSLTYSYANNSLLMYYFLSSEGTLIEMYWQERSENWKVVGSSLEDECDVYGKCGPFGICNSKDSLICSCLKGFEPMHTEEWSNGNWSSGCVRRTQLQCKMNNTVREMVKEDGFLMFSEVKVPDFAEALPPTGDCGSLCLQSCSCLGYAYQSGIRCMLWSGSLIDIKKFSAGGGADFYLCVADSELSIVSST